MENKNNKEKKTINSTKHLIPGSFSKCYYCDVDNDLCRKYNISR